MSIATLIIGESGTGKTASLRNLNPADVLLIQPVRKPLPFRSAEWKEIRAKGDSGNIFVCCDPVKICRAVAATTKKIVVIDDFQYVMSFAFMNRRNEKGFDKFTDIGGGAFDIAKVASELDLDKRVYILSHIDTDEMGNSRIKTLGKLLNDKIVLEGMFTTVLKTVVDQGAGKYGFSTQNSGHDTVKSPIGMFFDPIIENDLNEIDKVIVDYYGLAE